MGKITRKRHSADFKARVALEAIKGEQTLAEIGARHGVHLTQVAAWKKAAIEGMTTTFGSKASPAEAGQARPTSIVYTPRSANWWWNAIFWRKPSDVERVAEARSGESRSSGPVDRPAVRTCELLSISRSGYYHVPSGESAGNLMLMRLIEEQFMETPFYGSRQMTRHLRRLSHDVGRKRVRRLMRRMGLAAVYQRPRTSVPHPSHVIYPYLLRELSLNVRTTSGART